MTVNHTKKFVSRSDGDYSQCTNQHLQRPATKPWKPSAGSANCLTRHFSMCTEVTEQNVRYLRHVYNTSVKGKFRWNFTIRIFCGYAYFHMNHLEGQSPYWEANSQLVVKDISCLLWNLNVHYHNHKSQESGAWQMPFTSSYMISFRSFSIVSPTNAWVLPVCSPCRSSRWTSVHTLNLSHECYMSHPLLLSLNHAN